MDLQLAGMRAIVTGGTRGIGRAIVSLLSTEGCDIGFCARTAGAVAETQEKLRELGGNVVSGVIDVADLYGLRAWLAEAVRKLGGLDIFISNVSAQSFDWDRSYQVDIRACVTAVEEVLPYLQASKAGSIVAIGSQAAVLSVPSYKPYSAMKVALLSYMSALSRELAPSGIRVNVVSPSEIYFKGGFWERMEHEDPELFRSALAKNISGRFGTPEEVARAVVFLASPAASFISGAHLLVDFASRQHVQF
jgi:3-oxoacyl-[acyl-carrier protein] reductase